MRDGIFISYAHADGHWLGRLQQLLVPLDGLRVGAWDDTRIAPGSRWQGEIKEALDTAAAAVLLLSPAFFQSAFIRDHELPQILAAASRGELVVLPLVLSSCDATPVTATYQAVHDPARPLDALDDDGRDAVWQRLAASLAHVASTVGEEGRVGAALVRLANDVAAAPEVAHVLDKKSRAQVDPVFDGNETMRENTLVFLEGQRCQATATWLMEEVKRPDLPPARSKAIVRLLEQVARDEELALIRAKELTQHFADETLAMLQAAKAGHGDTA